MKLEVVSSSEKFSEEHDYRSYLKITLSDGSGKPTVLQFLDGEPEDANLCRDFSDCYSIEDAIITAYEAGKKGEELIIEEREIDDWE